MLSCFDWPASAAGFLLGRETFLVARTKEVNYPLPHINEAVKTAVCCGGRRLTQ